MQWRRIEKIKKKASGGGGAGWEVKRILVLRNREERDGMVAGARVQSTGGCSGGENIEGEKDIPESEDGGSIAKRREFGHNGRAGYQSGILGTKMLENYGGGEGKGGGWPMRRAQNSQEKKMEQ